jgi:hypothetical protein
MIEGVMRLSYFQLRILDEPSLIDFAQSVAISALPYACLGP